MSKAIPWWWTEKGNDKENDLFYESWKTVKDCFINNEFTDRAFIAEQIAGEKWEEEQIEKDAETVTSALTNTSETSEQWTNRVIKNLPVKPYYSHNGIIIINSDCREILPHLPNVDLVLTDPPYGIGEDGGKFRDRKGGGHRVLPKMGWDTSTPDKEIFGLILELGNEQIIWGGNYFTDKLPVSRGWLYWNKLMGGDFSDGELAWTSMDMVLKSFTKCNKMPGKEHPTQKPMELMQWCIGFAPESQTILDPYMGSGTTLRAAKDLGRKAIGIEIEERYAEIAARRLEQEVLQFEYEKQGESISGGVLAKMENGKQTSQEKELFEMPEGILATRTTKKVP